ncbi:MAG TPA: hypothetical protein VMU84_03955 [Thermoanaerobaculia bacterium]|nr:hypothetical protein [Thermoanaerobaculia bacterium]
MKGGTYPLFEVLDDRTSMPVNIAVWSVRAIYPVKIAGRELTRIEYTNGDAIDVTEDTTRVIMIFYIGCGGEP